MFNAIAGLTVYIFMVLALLFRPRGLFSGSPVVPLPKGAGFRSYFEPRSSLRRRACRRRAPTASHRAWPTQTLLSTRILYFVVMVSSLVRSGAREIRIALFQQGRHGFALVLGRLHDGLIGGGEFEAVGQAQLRGLAHQTLVQAD